MKNKDRKLLEASLLTGVEKAINAQRAVLTDKNKKAIRKILKQIARKASKEAGGLPPVQHSDLHSAKAKPTGVARIPTPKKKRNR